MASLINQSDVMDCLNNLMGRRETPGGIQSDLQRYCQTAFDYAWRYYPWDFSLKTATVTLTSGGLMPTDFDLMGYFRILSTPGNDWTYLSVEEYYSSLDGYRLFTMVWDSTANRYKFLTSFSASSVDIIYQIEPPKLDTETKVPFPSAMSVAVGAAIWAKQGENPTRADISQELDEFHNELDRHTGRAEANKARQRARTRQEVSGTYTGDVGD